MKKHSFVTLVFVAASFVSWSALAETRIVCDTQQIEFTPDTGSVSGNPISPDSINTQIKTLESAGMKVKVTQQSIAYGGFQAVAAAVSERFVNSHAVQYPTICVTLEIQ